MKITVRQLKQLIKEQVEEIRSSQGFFDEGEDEALQIAQGKLAGAIGKFENAITIIVRDGGAAGGDDEHQQIQDTVDELKRVYRQVANIMKRSKRFLK